MMREEFWSSVFENLGFKKVKIGEKDAFEISIHEAIYFHRLMGNNRVREDRGTTYIFSKNGDEIKFPEPCPTVLLREITTDNDEYLDIINPLLSPSLFLVKKKFPNFFEHETKYLLFDLDYSDIKELADKEGLNISDIITLHLPVDKYDVDENLLTYIFSKYFRDRGYIVDTFNERMSWGCTKNLDLYAFKIPRIQQLLFESGITNGGFYLNELELISERLSIAAKPKNNIKINEQEAIVIEVESPTSPSSRFSAGKNQLLPCLKGSYFTKGYVGIAFYEEKITNEGRGYSFEDEVGIMVLTRDGRLLIKESPVYGNKEKIDQLLTEVERIIKLTLLKNLPLKDIFELFPEVKSFYDIRLAVDDVETKDILEYVLSRSK